MHRPGSGRHQAPRPAAAIPVPHRLSPCRRLLPPVHPNAALIARFYAALDAGDAHAMAAAYADDAHFSDPVFGALDAPEVRAMWHMLTGRATDLRVRARDIEADDKQGRAHWQATYTYTATGRTVTNEIEARFRFKDGRIVVHDDRFDLWRWSRMALGPVGWLMGWSPPVRRRIRHQARRALERHRSRA